MSDVSNFSVWFYDLFELTRDEKENSIANNVTKNIFFNMLFPNKISATKVYRKLPLNDYVDIIRNVDKIIKKITETRMKKMTKADLVRLLEKYPDALNSKVYYGE